MTNYVLALDQRTSSTRAIIYNLHGELIVCSSYVITQYYPKTGWVEHDPEEIWSKTLQAVRDVLNKVPKNAILACGITNQRETTVLWNKKDGTCISRAIVWQDRRTEAYCAGLQAHQKLIHNKSGLFPDPYFSASKIHWLFENNKEARNLAKRGDLAFGTIDSYLIWRFSAGQSHVTDVTNASRTMLYNIHNRCWDSDLLDLFHIPDSILPQVHACDHYFGSIAKKWFGVAIPISGVAGDQQAALIGQACTTQGMIKATYGTGGFLILNTGTKPVSSVHKLLTTIAYQIKNTVHFGLEGSIYNAGTTIKWLRDELRVISGSEQSEQLAQSLDSNEGVYLISSFTGLGAPHWIRSVGAQIVGLSLKTGRAHLVRAALEGICYQTRDILACMREDSYLSLQELRADGGMSNNKWFLQYLANQCQLQVQQVNHAEATAKGVAIIAAIGVGQIANLDEADRLWSSQNHFVPCPNTNQFDKDYEGWQRALKHISANVN